MPARPRRRPPWHPPGRRAAVGTPRRHDKRELEGCTDEELKEACGDWDVSSAGGHDEVVARLLAEQRRRARRARRELARASRALQ